VDAFCFCWSTGVVGSLFLKEMLGEKRSFLSFPRQDDAPPFSLRASHFFLFSKARSYTDIRVFRFRSSIDILFLTRCVDASFLPPGQEMVPPYFSFAIRRRDSSFQPKIEYCPSPLSQKLYARTLLDFSPLFLCIDRSLLKRVSLPFGDYEH